MAEYYVTWEITLEAEDAYEAAEKALAIQRDPESIATVFQAQTEGLAMVEIDLTEGTVR